MWNFFTWRLVAVFLFWQLAAFLFLTIKTIPQDRGIAGEILP